MPYNGSGTFTRLYNWVTDRDASIKITASRMDAEMDGMATGLSNAITKDGQTTITQNIPFNNKKITGLADAAADTDALNRRTADARYLQSGTKSIKAENLDMDVVDKDLATPPVSPSSGDAYIVAATATDDWASKEDNIARWNGSAWVFTAPTEGMVVWVADENLLYGYDGSAWASAGASVPDGAITNAKIRDAAAVSVIGRSANTSGDVDDIAAGANDTLLRRVADALSWGGLTIGMFGANLVTYAKIQQVSNASRFLGRITSGAGDIEELTGAQATSLLSAMVGDSGSGGTKGLVPAPGTGDAAANKFLKADATWAALTQTVVDRVYAEYTANTDLSTAIPYDDTVPQSSEGVQILSVSITPKSTTNRLRVRFRGRWSGWDGSSSAAGWAAAALFQDSNANALAADMCNSAIEENGAFNIEYEFVPGSTNATTLKVRVGPSGTITLIRMNGAHAARKLGGAQRATLIVEELYAT